MCKDMFRFFRTMIWFFAQWPYIYKVSKESRLASCIFLIVLLYYYVPWFPSFYHIGSPRFRYIFCCMRGRNLSPSFRVRRKRVYWAVIESKRFSARLLRLWRITLHHTCLLTFWCVLWHKTSAPSRTRMRQKVLNTNRGIWICSTSCFKMLPATQNASPKASWFYPFFLCSVLGNHVCVSPPNVTKKCPVYSGRQGFVLGHEFGH